MRGARTSHVRSVAVPLIMYGTAWKEDRTQALVLEAIATGFRAFDTANQRKHYVEEEVSAAVRTAIASGTVTQEDQLWSLLPEPGFRHSSGLAQGDWETWRAMEAAVGRRLRTRLSFPRRLTRPREPH